jgi:hypothetical protein
MWNTVLSPESKHKDYVLASVCSLTKFAQVLKKEREREEGGGGGRRKGLYVML